MDCKYFGPFIYFSPNSTRMADYSLFAQKWISNLRQTASSVFSCCFQLRTGTVFRPYWIIPTRCTSSLNPVCIQSSCQRHRWVSCASKQIRSLYQTREAAHFVPWWSVILCYFLCSGTPVPSGKNWQNWCLSITTFPPSSSVNQRCCLRIL